MLTKADGIQVKSTQALRVQEHPIQTDKNLIIVDNLEMGKSLLKRNGRMRGFLSTVFFGGMDRRISSSR